MIRCQNCGAEYSEKDFQCPYCGAENVKRSVSDQKEFLSDIRKRTEALYSRPETAAKRASSKTTRIMIIIAIAAALLVAASFVVSGIIKNKRENDRTRILQELEDAYISNDYDRISSIIDRNGLYQDSYRKYEELYYIYRSYTYGCEGIEELTFFDDEFLKNDHSLFDMYMDDLFKSLDSLEILKDNGFVYDEEHGYQYLKGKVIEAFREYHITPEQVTEYLELYRTEKDPDYTELNESYLGGRE